MFISADGRRDVRNISMKVLDGMHPEDVVQDIRLEFLGKILIICYNFLLIQFRAHINKYSRLTGYTTHYYGEAQVRCSSDVHAPFAGWYVIFNCQIYSQQITYRATFSITNFSDYHGTRRARENLYKVATGIGLYVSLRILSLYDEELIY
jgi:hypothetical protein